MFKYVESSQITANLDDPGTSWMWNYSYLHDFQYTSFMTSDIHYTVQTFNIQYSWHLIPINIKHYTHYSLNYTLFENKK